MKPETRIGITTFVKVLTYVVSILIWAALGRLARETIRIFYYADPITLVIIGALLGAFFAFWVDFFIYTTFIRLDEILLALNTKNSFDRESVQELNRNLQDIKTLLEKLNANVSAGGKDTPPESGLYV